MECLESLKGGFTASAVGISGALVFGYLGAIYLQARGYEGVMRE